MTNMVSLLVKVGEGRMLGEVVVMVMRMRRVIGGSTEWEAGRRAIGGAMEAGGAFRFFLLGLSPLLTHILKFCASRPSTRCMEGSREETSQTYLLACASGRGVAC